MGKREPLKEVYRLKVAGLAVLETLSESGDIELLYGDAAHLNRQPEVPYGWQFRDEKVFMPSEQGTGINLFGFLSRTNRLVFEMTSERITGDFVVRQIEKLVTEITKPTAHRSGQCAGKSQSKDASSGFHFGKGGAYISFICRCIRRI